MPHNPEEFLAYRYGNDWKIRKLRNKSYKDTTIRTWKILKKTLKIPMYFNIFEENVEKGKIE